LSADIKDIDIRQTIELAFRDRLEKERQKRLARLFLAANPFPVASISSQELAVSFPPIDQQQLESVQRFLQSTISGKRYSGLLVVGDYGFGKSHFLRWFEHTINNLGKGYLVAYYIQDPGRSPRELLFAFTKAIGEESLRKYIWFLVFEKIRGELKKDSKKLQSRLFAKPTGEMDLKSYAKKHDLRRSVFNESALSNFQVFLESYDKFFGERTSLRLYIQEVLRGITRSADVSRLLASFALQEEFVSDDAWSALTSIERKGALAISPSEHFRALLSLLKSTGLVQIYLLIDEFEDITAARLPTRQRGEYAASLRTLIDTHLTDFSLVIACTRKGLTQLRGLHPAFVERFNYHIDLKPLALQQVKQLVLGYLDLARRGTAFAPNEGKLEPFEEDALKKLTLSAKGNPRSVLSLCHELVEYAAEKGLDKISASVVSTVESSVELPVENTLGT
jgi:type II secretory pathway predicted ATPase ExeA